MDANWQPVQGSNPPAGVDPNAPAGVDSNAPAGVDPNAPADAVGGDWRTELTPGARGRIVNYILETLKKHLPVSEPEGLNELKKIVVQFEEKIYTAVTSLADYLRELSLKMLSMDTRTPQAPGNAKVIPNQNNPGQATAPRRRGRTRPPVTHPYYLRSSKQPQQMT